jgi:O-antigen ligase
VDLLNHKAHNPLTGFGIGNYASFVAFKYSTTGNNILMSYFIYNPNKPIYIDSQIIPLLGEFGYLGLLLFIILFGLIIFRLRHILNIARSDLARTISSTTLAYSIFFCFGFFINRFLEQPNTSMLLFLFVGLSESIFITEKQGTSYDPNKKNQK